MSDRVILFQIVSRGVCSLMISRNDKRGVLGTLKCDSAVRMVSFRLMKVPLGVLAVLICAAVTLGQSTSSTVKVVTVWSESGEYYLKSIPYDDEEPSLRGRSLVYRKGGGTPAYAFDRGFDSVDGESNNLVLSNDGEVVFYAIPWGADEKKEGLKSVTIYRHGAILASFTKAEITGCDEKRERCGLVYSNYDEVVDKEKSNWGTRNYKKAFKRSTGEKERFLSDYPIFSGDDTVYLTDSKKNVHLFDLKEGKYIGSQPFDAIFAEIRQKGRFNKTEIRSYEAPVFLDFPRLKDGKDPVESLARDLGMKAASVFKEEDEQYRLYRFKMNSILSRDGSLEIEDIEIHDDLPKQKIIEFFRSNKFDVSSVPDVFDRWYVGEKYFYFRNSNDAIARQEKQRQTLEARVNREKRMTLETIDGVYIPKDLGECFKELDKLLPEIDKKEMQALPWRGDMIRYHLGLGMWIRNNWGLWGGSRLQRYFTDRGVTHPDSMSPVILEYYYDWLHGKKDTWKDWQGAPKKSPQSSNPAAAEGRSVA